MRISLIALMPLILLLDIVTLNYAFDLLRQKSDVAVLAGVSCLTLLCISNYYLYLFINKHLNKKK